jgi:hypothetical protein
MRSEVACGRCSVFGPGLQAVFAPFHEAVAHRRAGAEQHSSRKAWRRKLRISAKYSSLSARQRPVVVDAARSSACAARSGGPGPCGRRSWRGRCCCAVACRAGCSRRPAGRRACCPPTAVLVAQRAVDELVDLGELVHAVLHAGVHAGDQFELALAVVGGDVRVRQRRQRQPRPRQGAGADAEQASAPARVLGDGGGGAKGTRLAVLEPGQMSLAPAQAFLLATATALHAGQPRRRTGAAARGTAAAAGGAGQRHPGRRCRLPAGQRGHGAAVAGRLPERTAPAAGAGAPGRPPPAPAGQAGARCRARRRLPSAAAGPGAAGARARRAADRTAGRLRHRAAPRARLAAAGSWVLSLRELLGLVSAHEWRKNGVPVAALGAPPHNRIHPHYGVFSPVRGEYLQLVADMPRCRPCWPPAWPSTSAPAPACWPRCWHGAGWTWSPPTPIRVRWPARPTTWPAWAWPRR